MTESRSNGLAALLAAGFPRELLIPIVPGDIAPTDRIDEKMLGKVPAMRGAWGWHLIRTWEQGVAPDAQDEADANGCNWGLRLGEAGGGARFLGFDVDTEPEQDAALAGHIQRIVIQTIRGALGHAKIWLRFTRPGRLGFLLRIPASESPGSKATLKMTLNEVSCGKLELLARGQQMVLSGMHAYAKGTPIRWARLDQPKIVRPVPLLDDALAQVANRESAGGVMEALKDSLEVNLGISFLRQGRSTTDAVGDRAALDPERRAPWSVQDFIDTLNQMPHPDDMTRDDFIAFMLACAGSIQGAEQTGLADQDAASRMAEAAVAWAARWGGQEGNAEAAQAAWESDFSQRVVVSVGWPQIIEQAVALGRDDLRHEAAKRMFAEPAPPPKIQRLPRMPAGEDLPVRRRSQRLRFDVKTSDIQIADAIEDSLRSLIAWIEDEKQWIAWSGTAAGWAHPFGERLMRTWVEDELVRYVDRHGDDLGDREDVRSQLTSVARVNAMERILRSRLGMQSEEADLGIGVLQTPAGAFSLADGRKVDPVDQKALYERRCTGVSPAVGKTPLFDGLLLHLACGVQEIADWLWAYSGYALLGMPRAHAMLVVYGPGGNGKSALANILRRIAGTYATPIDRRVILQSGTNDHPTSIMDAKGRRLWLVSEFKQEEKWNEEQVKSLTGGDPIRAHRMHRDSTMFMPQGTFFITTNNLPRFNRIDMAVVRRLRLLHARLKVPKVDPGFEDRVMAMEAPAILARLMDEARQAHENGVTLPPVPVAMQGEARAYFSEQDRFQLWFGDECDTVMSLQERADVAELYRRYQRHVQAAGEDDGGGANGLDVLPLSAFLVALQRSGAVVNTGEGQRIRDRGTQFVAGVRLKVRLA